MYSQKNRNKSFIYEEEIDQINREKFLKKFDNSFLENHPELKDVSLKVHGEDIKLDTEKITILYPFLKDSKELKKKKIVLPKWIERSYLDLYFSITVNGKFPKMDSHATKKLISICEYFKNIDLIGNLINEIIMPNLDKFTCLKILKDYLDKVDNEQTKSLYTDLVQRCFEIASKNIFYLINNHQSDLAILNEESLEEIIERYFESVILNINIDHSLIIRLMINLRKLNDIFELLENERRRSINTFDRMLNESLNPTLSWKFKSSEMDVGFYKESDDFTYENISFAVLNSYDNVKDIYQIAIKITKVIYESQNIDNTSIIFSILSLCEIPEISFKSKINFNCINNNPKARVLITKIENFSKLFLNPTDFVLKIYLNLSYNFSSIFTHICKNYYEYHSLPSIGKIPKNVLNLIIKNKNLNVRSEDEKLFSIITHLSHKQSTNQERIEDLFSAISWKSVSLDGLLEFIVNDSKLLLTSSFLQEILIGEFRRRFKDDNVSIIHSTEDILNKSKSPSYKNINQFSRSKEKIPLLNTSSQSFTSDLVIKLIKIASRYESQYKNSAYSNHTTSSNTNSNINSQSNYPHKMLLISGQNTSRNTNNGMNDSKTPFSVLQEINTSPSISENSYLKNYSNKQTFDNINKARRLPWKANSIKVEKNSLKIIKSKSQNPSKVASNSSTPKKSRDRSQQLIRPINEKPVTANISNIINKNQPMNYNKIYQKLKAKTTIPSRNNINSFSYGSFKIARYDNLNNTDRKKRSLIDNVFNSLIVNNVSISPIKDGYSKNAMYRIKNFETPNSTKKLITRPKSANILKY